MNVKQPCTTQLENMFSLIFIFTFHLVTGHNINGISLPHPPSTLSQMKAGTVTYQNIQVNWCFSYKITVYFKLFPKTTFLPSKKKSCYKYLQHLCQLNILDNRRDKTLHNRQYRLCNIYHWPTTFIFSNTVLEFFINLCTNELGHKMEMNWCKKLVKKATLILE